MARRSHVHGRMVWLAVMDVACLLLGGVLGVAIRFGGNEIGEYLLRHVDGWLVLCAGVLLANYLAGSYRLMYTYSRFNLFVTWLFSLLFALLILSTFSYAWFSFMLGRGVLLLALAGYSLLALLIKLVVYRSLFRSELFLCRVVVLGTGEKAREMRRLLEHPDVLPAHKVVAYMNADAANDAEHNAPPILEDGVAVVPYERSSLVDVVQSLGARLFVVAADRDRAELYPYLKRLRFGGVEVLTPLGVAEIYRGRTPLDELNEDVLLQVSMESDLPMNSRVKRFFSFFTALVGTVVFAPVMLLVALIIKLSEPGLPALYRQQRVGRFGEAFTIYKFRTMTPDAEAETGAVWAQCGDQRITSVGRVLRRFRLDELPQLFNVLVGDMSLVGPRPERPELVEQIAAEIPFYRERENVMPGITGWAQIQYPYGNTMDDARRKLEYDLYYIKHVSFSLDLQILLRTLRIVLFGLEHKT